ncbi:hypothetical protein CKAH01_15918 [Colletotrichum kahawae]|uniref:Uncharacterized protein n=1 Tax=Colletotrichum kahawae TaxID=34407 RepID=A0AAD9YGZ4_COLKA|nr:hypothetical protein CKAH01_15918 [Colletotrichum kahawae]
MIGGAPVPAIAGRRSHAATPRDASEFGPLNFAHNAPNRCDASFDVRRTEESATKGLPVPIIHLSPTSGGAKPSGPAPWRRRTV